MGIRSQLLLMLCIVAGFAAPVVQADELADSRAGLYKRYAEQLAALATWCDQQGLRDSAECTRRWLPPRDPNTIMLFVLPEVADWQWPGKLDNDPPQPAKPELSKAVPAAKDDAPTESVLKEGDAVKEPSPYAKTTADPLDPWRGRFRKLRESQADELFDLARQAITEKRVSLAHELILETAHENPDHKKARRLLGYLYSHERWQTAFAVQQQGLGRVWHPRFGWLAKNQVARYERGQRFYQNRWISAEEDSRVHSDVNNGWQVETAHYVVTTNHSLEEGVQLAERLERLYSFWQTLFAGYVVGDAELIRRFEGRSLVGRDGHKHAVNYFRNRDEYNAALCAEQPQIDITLGIYFDKAHKAYFFAGPDQQPGTIYHEATHQLFQETRLVAKEVGRAGNFWIIEAIACYMESLTEHDAGYFTLGGATAGRMPAARQRLLTDKFYVPLATLVTYGMETLQRDPNIAKLYSESAGLATFLMNDDSGRYREAVIGYLEAIYSGRANERTLAEQAGKKYVELDAEYRRFLERN